MRLIDAEPIEIRYNTETLGRREMYEMVKTAPTIDAVPVVRCDECECWHELEHRAGTCNRFALEWLCTDATDFCSFAERKDDE